MLWPRALEDGTNGDGWALEQRPWVGHTRGVLDVGRRADPARRGNPIGNMARAGVISGLARSIELLGQDSGEKRHTAGALACGRADHT